MVEEAMAYLNETLDYIQRYSVKRDLCICEQLPLRRCERKRFNPSRSFYPAETSV